MLFFEDYGRLAFITESPYNVLNSAIVNFKTLKIS